MLSYAFNTGVSAIPQHELTHLLMSSEHVLSLTHRRG